MPTLNALARQPAHGLGEAGRGRAVLTGLKKTIGGNPSAIYSEEKKDNLSYIRLLATDSTTLGGRHFMKEEVYFPHTDCVGISFD